MKYFKNIKQTTKLKYHINYLVILFALVLFMILGANGMLLRSDLNLLSRIPYSIILAVSLNLVVGFLGELSLGHAGFMCVGAYIGCFCANLMSETVGSPLAVLILSMLIGGGAAAVFGFIIGLPALRLKGDYLAIVTLAFGEIVRNIFMNLDGFGGALGLRTKTYDLNKLYIVSFIAVILVVVISQNLIRSKHGRAITAIRDNEIAAKAMGINVTFYKLLVFVISAFFAGIAGVLYGHYATPVIYTFFSYNYSIEILVMVVLGGMGNINGSIIAAVAITYINVQLQSKLSGDLAALKLLIYALILIIIVLFNNAPAFRPFKEKLNLKGLISKFKKKNDSTISDDDAQWHRIESKIKMDELLSVDVTQSDYYTPDKAKKEDK